MFKFKRKAFTLIELLIVIAIIAILAGIIITATTGATKKARDSKRVADMKMLYNAIVQYEADHGEYPPCLQDLVDEGYISAIPMDPLSKKRVCEVDACGSCKSTSTTYIYQSLDSARFVLAANLETSDSSALDGDIDKTITAVPPLPGMSDYFIHCNDETACDDTSGKHCYCIGINYNVVE